MSTHHLSEDQRRMLQCANQLMTALTLSHDASCTCELCDARMNTDVQEEGSFHVRYKPLRETFTND